MGDFKGLPSFWQTEEQTTPEFIIRCFGVVFVCLIYCAILGYPILLTFSHIIDKNTEERVKLNKIRADAEERFRKEQEEKEEALRKIEEKKLEKQKLAERAERKRIREEKKAAGIIEDSPAIKARKRKIASTNILLPLEKMPVGNNLLN
jgi:hypothetical protein